MKLKDHPVADGLRPLMKPPPSTPLKTEPRDGTRAIGVDSIGRGYYYVIYYSNRFFYM
jgi:hypothetical protein